MNAMDYEEQQEALQALVEARKYVQDAHDAAEGRHDSYGEDYMSGGLYEVMEATEDLIKRIDSILDKLK